MGVARCSGCQATALRLGLDTRRIASGRARRWAAPWPSSPLPSLHGRTHRTIALPTPSPEPDCCWTLRQTGFVQGRRSRSRSDVAGALDRFRLPITSRADLPLFRPGISQVGADRASVVRCRRSLLVAVARCCCCHPRDASAPGHLPRPGCRPFAPPPIGLTAADPFTGGKVSRVASRVR